MADISSMGWSGTHFIIDSEQCISCSLKLKSVNEIQVQHAMLLFLSRNSGIEFTIKCWITLLIFKETANLNLTHGCRDE